MRSIVWGPVVTLALLGCSSDANEAVTPVERPHVLSASFFESVEAPLTGTLKVTLDRAATLHVVATEPGGHRIELTSKASAPAHELPILGLRAAREYALSVTAVDAAGHASDVSLVPRRTPRLPADFPKVRVEQTNKAKTGLTLFPVSRFTPGDFDAGVPQAIDRWGYLVAVDGAGEVVWWVDTLSTVADVQRGSRGQIRYGFNEAGIAEITPLGRLERALLAQGPARGPVDPGFIPVAADTLHHDVIELPNGHWLTLATEARSLGPSDCPTYDKTYTVVGDDVLELDPATGAIVSKVRLFDLLDPCRRVDADFKSQFWSPVYGAGSADWTHANSLFYDPSRNVVFVSLRHQDWVLGIRRDDDASGKAGSLMFKFGPEGDFPLSGDGALFPYHQHAARILSNGHLALFDNGTTRPGTNDAFVTQLPPSRAAEFELMTSGPQPSWKATQVWHWGEDQVRALDGATGKSIPWYSPVVGDSVYTADGTVLITYGALLWPPAGFLLNPKVRKSARVVEVTHEAAGKVVFDLRVEDPADKGTDYLVYRATRIPTLYPPNVADVTVSMR